MVTFVLLAVGAILGASRDKCFWRHSWAKWETKDLMRLDSKAVVGITQTRTCNRCGYRQMERVF